MSEGINFSDGLARCVIVVGLPYPDPRDAVLKEKLRFCEERSTAEALEPSTTPLGNGFGSIGSSSSSSSSSSSTGIEPSNMPAGAVSAAQRISASAVGSAASRRMYENICLKVVNQSIGRSIRHANDFAAILLLDRRFASDRVRGLLPAWIQSSAQTSDFSSLASHLDAFFRKQRERTCN